MVQVEGLDQGFIGHPRALDDVAFEEADVADAGTFRDGDVGGFHAGPGSGGDAAMVKTFCGKPIFLPAFPEVAAARGSNGVEPVPIRGIETFGVGFEGEVAEDLAVCVGREEDFGAEFVGASPVCRSYEKVNFASGFILVQGLVGKDGVISKLGGVHWEYLSQGSGL